MTGPRASRLSRSRTLALILLAGIAMAGCARVAVPESEAEPQRSPQTRAHMLTAEQAAGAGEAPAPSSPFRDVLPPPDWMSTDWLVSSPD